MATTTTSDTNSGNRSLFYFKLEFGLSFSDKRPHKNHTLTIGNGRNRSLDSLQATQSPNFASPGATAQAAAAAVAPLSSPSSPNHARRSNRQHHSHHRHNCRHHRHQQQQLQLQQQHPYEQFNNNNNNNNANALEYLPIRNGRTRHRDPTAPHALDASRRDKSAPPPLQFHHHPYHPFSPTNRAPSTSPLPRRHTENSETIMRCRLGEQGMPWSPDPMFTEPNGGGNSGGFLSVSSSLSSNGKAPERRSFPPRSSSKPMSSRILHNPRLAVVKNQQQRNHERMLMVRHSTPTVVSTDDFLQQKHPQQQENQQQDASSLSTMHNLTALQNAMLTIDNGFEGQWWNQGPRIRVSETFPGLGDLSIELPNFEVTDEEDNKGKEGENEERGVEPKEAKGKEIKTIDTPTPSSSIAQISPKQPSVSVESQPSPSSSAVSRPKLIITTHSTPEITPVQPKQYVSYRPGCLNTRSTSTGTVSQANPQASPPPPPGWVAGTSLGWAIARTDTPESFITSIKSDAGTVAEPSEASNNDNGIDLNVVSPISADDTSTIAWWYTQDRQLSSASPVSA